MPEFDSLYQSLEDLIDDVLEHEPETLDDYLDLLEGLE